MLNGSGTEPRLARVTYLPGVVPPASRASATTASSIEFESFPESTVPEDEVLESTVPEALEGAAPVPLEEAVPVPLEEAVPEALEGAVPTAQLRAQMSEILDRGAPAAPPETEGERSARAHNVSMHALTRKGLSIQEMTDHLRGRELDEAVVDYEVTRLIEVGLLDDNDLAENLVRTLRERKGLGRTAITSELRRRKIDPHAIEQALEADREDHGDDELTRARELAVKRAPQLRSLDAETARRRLGAFLMRKGYSGSIVASAVASALAPGGSSRNAPTASGPRFQ
jgi:regulatory protein